MVQTDPDPQVQPTSTFSKPSRTSSPTPPFSRTNLIIRATVFLFTPPRLGLHTPGASSSLVDGLTTNDPSVAPADPPVATFSEFGTPGCVNRDGGSTVRIDRSFRPSDSLSRVTEMAMTVSATVISSRFGSKMMLSPTEMTSRVTGGRILCGSLDRVRGYRCSAASQSSSKKGSSSPLDFSFGSLVERRARCVVRERRGSG